MSITRTKYHEVISGCLDSGHSSFQEQMDSLAKAGFEFAPEAISEGRRIADKVLHADENGDLFIRDFCETTTATTSDLLKPRIEQCRRALGDAIDAALATTSAPADFHKIASELHRWAMNVTAEFLPADDGDAGAYKKGHRDARHAIAEMISGYFASLPSCPVESADAIKELLESGRQLELWRNAKEQFGAVVRLDSGLNHSPAYADSWQAAARAAVDAVKGGGK